MKPLTLDRFQAAALRRGATMLPVPMKPQPPEDCYALSFGMYNPTKIDRDGMEYPGAEVFGAWSEDGEFGCPAPFAPGQRVPCKEAWARNYALGHVEKFKDHMPHYRVDLPMDPDEAMTANHAFGLMKWQSARSMPLNLVRTHSFIQSVRPVRVEDVTEAEALGMGFDAVRMCKVEDGRAISTHDSYAESFRDYWRTRHKGDWMWLYQIKVD